MSLKIDDIKIVLDTLGHLESKGKKTVASVDRMEGCFTELFPKDKGSVDIIRDSRRKLLES